MKVLIVKLSAFGDMIHTLPALDDLLQRPEVNEVHWLVDARYAFVTEIFPANVIVHRISLKDAYQVHDTWKIVRSLRKEQFDAVLDLQGLIKSGVLARLISPRVFGIDAAYVREKPNRYFAHPVRFHPNEKHVVQQSRRVATAPFRNDWQQVPVQAMPYREPRIPLTAAMSEAAKQILAEWGVASKSYVWLHLGGGWETKQLPQSTWEQVINGLTERGVTPLLGWGNAAENTVAEAIHRRSPTAILPAQRSDMPSLCGILAGAAAVVGADTGVIHLAAALTAPTVSFWGPSAAWRSSPLGDANQQVESNPPCGPCFARTCSHFICMDMIGGDDILSAIDDISTSH